MHNLFYLCGEALLILSCLSRFNLSNSKVLDNCSLSLCLWICSRFTGLNSDTCQSISIFCHCRFCLLADQPVQRAVVVYRNTLSPLSDQFQIIYVCLNFCLSSVFSNWLQEEYQGNVQSVTYQPGCFLPLILELLFLWQKKYV